MQCECLDHRLLQRYLSPHFRLHLQNYLLLRDRLRPLPLHHLIIRLLNIKLYIISDRSLKPLQNHQWRESLQREEEEHCLPQEVPFQLGCQVSQDPGHHKRTMLHLRIIFLKFSFSLRILRIYRSLTVIRVL